MRDSLAKIQQTEPMTTNDLLQKKTKAWHNKIALVITYEQMQTFGLLDYAECIRLGNKLYGDNK